MYRNILLAVLSLSLWFAAGCVLKKNAWHALSKDVDLDATRIGIAGHSYGGKMGYAGILFVRRSQPLNEVKPENKKNLCMYEKYFIFASLIFIYLFITPVCVFCTGKCLRFFINKSPA